MSPAVWVVWPVAMRFGDEVTLWRGGRLTTDHAASSHGLPVLIEEGGQVRGPGEVAELTVETRPLSAAATQMIEAARRAGYHINEPPASRRCDAELQGTRIRCQKHRHPAGEPHQGVDGLGGDKTWMGR